MIMFDENNNELMNNGENGSRRTEEPVNTEFTMRDAEPASHTSYDRQESYAEAPQYHNMDYSNIPEGPDQKPKKKRSVAGKVAGITAAAVLFGTVAGGTMAGVNYLAGGWKTNYPQVSQSATLNTVEATDPTPGTANVVPAISTDVSAIVEKAMPSVVAINNTMVQEAYSWYGTSQFYEVPSSGSGIIIGQNETELLIVTNNHVVTDSKELKVNFIDNTSINAAVKGTDSDSDLAVIAVPLADIPAETLSKISVAQMGNSDDLKVGQGVIAIGNALGYGQSVTVGYVSALNREVKTDEQTTRDLLQTDAAINPGNSGGALLNMQGEVIGINAAKYSATGIEGMGYAIPISKAQDIIGELMNKKTRITVAEKDQGYLGIQGMNVEQAMSDGYGMPTGVYVYKIVEEGAASRSDLREKDIITKVDGQTISSMNALKEMLTYYKGGEKIALSVQTLENGQYVERIVEVTLDKRPQNEPVIKQS